MIRPRLTAKGRTSSVKIQPKKPKLTTETQSDPARVQFKYQPRLPKKTIERVISGNVAAMNIIRGQPTTAEQAQETARRIKNKNAAHVILDEYQGLPSPVSQSSLSRPWIDAINIIMPYGHNQYIDGKDADDRIVLSRWLTEDQSEHFGLGRPKTEHTGLWIRPLLKKNSLFPSPPTETPALIRRRLLRFADKANLRLAPEEEDIWRRGNLLVTYLELACFVEFRKQRDRNTFHDALLRMHAYRAHASKENAIYSDCGYLGRNQRAIAFYDPRDVLSEKGQVPYLSEHDLEILANSFIEKVEVRYKTKYLARFELTTLYDLEASDASEKLADAYGFTFDGMRPRSGETITALALSPEETEELVAKVEGTVEREALRAWASGRYPDVEGSTKAQLMRKGFDFSRHPSGRTYLQALIHALGGRVIEPS